MFDRMFGILRFDFVGFGGEFGGHMWRIFGDVRLNEGFELLWMVFRGLLEVVFLT